MRLLLLLLLLQLDMVIRVLNNVFSPVALRQLYAYADANRSRSKKLRLRTVSPIQKTFL